MVLGHDTCGAVAAAVDAVAIGSQAVDEINYLVKQIRPAVQQERRRPGDPIENAVRANAVMVAERLCAGANVAREVSAGALRVLAACYEPRTGRVEFLRGRRVLADERWRSPR